MDYILEFEKPVYALENQIKELESNQGSNLDLSGEIKALRDKVDHLIVEIYKNLSPWDRVQLARHPLRPHSIDYIKELITDFHELHGDRQFSDDASILGGLGWLDDQKVAVISIEKGRKTQDKVLRNFGMPHPEGYRKAKRLMDLAERFHIPLITFVDTPGAYPGIAAEERGQAQAIADNLEFMFSLKIPIMSFIIGEGGSGGALGIAIANQVIMLEHSIYSVISPESCASILWSDPKKAEQAANSLKLTSLEAKRLGVVDQILSEPPGGAHRNPKEIFESVKKLISQNLLPELNSLSGEQRKEQRFEKFRKMGNSFLRNS
ncbi:MAG: acetyl-CoA carboxylase carboxyltransferase subunit alpha [Bacteriovoracaceae bacterium]|nr:acetyl-CoA carboxylase carboxyltransferase subunit alpha [Bacteriovoracaceae bacterium]